MVSGGEEGKGGGGKSSATEHGAAKKHSLPPGQHEHPPFAFGQTWSPETQSHPFWHPAPKDLPEPPIHFHKNAVNLELHLGDPRQRLAGMTDAERAWRKKFVHDQHLSAEEPVYVPEVFDCFNPLRRIYRMPWDALERRILIPALGFNKGHYTRAAVPKFMMAIAGLMWFWYHVKYFHPTWVDDRRGRVILQAQPLHREAEIREKEPGLIEKALRQYPTKQDYTDFGFKDRYTHLNLGPPFRP